MLKYVLISLIILLTTSCKNKDEENKNTASVENAAVSDSSAPDSFFPVSNYIRGQINDIRSKGVNPVIYTTAGTRTDSSWLKAEDFEKEMAPFLEINIDTANLKDLFSEKKFLDQTLNAYTFSYDPKGALPDTLSLRHWDIYVDPGTNKIRRIYLIKTIKENKEQQLTWQSDKWCKVVTIGKDKNDNSIVEKEVLIKWDF